MSSAVVGVKREGSCRIRSSGGLPVFEETYIYRVETDNKSEPYNLVATTTGLPTVGVSASPTGIGICRGVSGTRNSENPFWWEFVCEFSSEVDENQDNYDPTTDPTAWVPIYETKFERLQELVAKDKDGTTIANSAGQPFQVGLTIGRFIPVWEFYQFEPATVDDETIIERNETVNSATFKGRAAKTLLLTVVSSVVGFYYGQRRRLTKYSLKYNDREWTHKRQDVGTVYLDSGERKAYTDDEDPPNVILGGLNGSGAKVAVGDPPATLTFDIYEPISFSFLRV